MTTVALSHGVGRPKTIMVMKNALHPKICKKNQRFPTFPTDAQPRTRHQIHAPQPHWSNPKCIPISCVHYGAICRGTPERMAAQSLGSKKITDPLGLPQSTKRWLQRLRSEGELVSHPRGNFHDAALDLTLSCFTVNLQCLHSFMVLVPSRRCVGKQTPAAQEVHHLVRRVVFPAA